MALPETHPREDLIRYLDGALDENEKGALEKHLETCPDCRRYLSNVKDFNQGLTELGEEEFSSREPCPDSWTLVAYEAGKIDEESARNLRVHLLFCDDCREEFYDLRRASREESWRELVDRLKESVIDLAKTYGPQKLLGSIRIVSEQPALARGGETPKAISKALEVPLGENVYSVELAITEDGFVSFDIAGVRTPAKMPLGIFISSETGGELMSGQTDEFGNTHFVVPSTADDLLLVTLTLNKDEQQLLFRVPQSNKPT